MANTGDTVPCSLNLAVMYNTIFLQIGVNGIERMRPNGSEAFPSRFYMWTPLSGRACKIPTKRMADRVSEV